MMKQSLGAKTILYPTPVVVVGTYDKQKKPNMMTVGWVGICCSKPPCVAVSLRKATYTYSNIVERGAFTVNVPSEKYIKDRLCWNSFRKESGEVFCHKANSRQE